jgi:hypothetical protein
VKEKTSQFCKNKKKLIERRKIFIFSATPTNTLPRHASITNTNAEQDLVNRNIAFNSAINNCSNSDLTVTSSSMRDIPCTLQNCDLNTNCSLIRSSSSLSSTGVIGTSGCYSAPSTMKMNQQNQTSNQSLAQILATNQSTQNLFEHWNSIDCLGSGAVPQILPPPLFDTNCSTTGNYNQCYEIQNHPGNYCTLSAIEMPKMPSSSKRLHRTIPKHFTMSSPSSAVLNSDAVQHQSMIGGVRNVEQNKKPSCQCPVQHVPMTYMQFSSAQVSQNASQPLQEIAQSQQQQQQQQQHQQQHQQQQHQSFSQQRHQHSIYMSGGSNSSSSSGGGKKNNVIKSTTFPSAMNNVQNVSATGSSKIQTITNAELMGIGTDVLQSNATSHHIDMGAAANIMSSGTLRRSHKSSSNSASSSANAGVVMPTTPNKKSIATISVASPMAHSTVAGTPGFFTPKLDTKPPQIHSILKNKNQSNCHINVININEGAEQQNPILPPKMYKNNNNNNNNGKYSVTASGTGATTPGGSKQIHTITRPNELTSSSQFTLLSINGTQKYQQHSPQYQQPTQLRTNIQVNISFLFLFFLN